MLGSLPLEHVPLYFVTMRPWTILAGEGDFALRFPSALAGAIAIALAGFVGARLFGRMAGATSALLVATQLFAISYGQEARMYSLLLALALAAPAAVLRAESLERRGSPVRRWWIGAGILTAFAALTHYYGALAAFALAAWVLHDMYWATRQSGTYIRPIFRRWFMVFGTAAVIFLPWLPRAMRIGDFPGWRETTPGAALRSILGAWLGGTSIGSDPVSGAAASAGAVGALEPGIALHQAALIALPLLIAAIGAAWALFTLITRRPIEIIDSARLNDPTADDSDALWTAASRLLAWLVVPAAVVGLLLLRSPDMHPRYLMPLHAAVWIAAGAGAAAIIRRLPRRWRTLSALTLLTALTLSSAAPLAAYRSGEERQKQSYRALLTEVDRHADGRDSILLLDGPPFGLIERYAVPDSQVKIENLHSTTNRARDPEGFKVRLEELVERRPNVWLAEDGANQGLADAWLAEHLYPVSTTGYQDITLSRFFAPPRQVIDEITPERIGEHCVDFAGDFVELDAADLAETEFTLPHLAIPESAALCLGTISDAVLKIVPGDVAPIWLEWQPGAAWPASAPASREHRVSVRLVNRDGAVVVSADRRPAAWTRPTTGWTPGEFVQDRHGLLIPAEKPIGLHRIEIVFYDEETLGSFAVWKLPPTIEVVGVRSVTDAAEADGSEVEADDAESADEAEDDG